MDRQCARPGCANQAAATLTFEYTSGRAWIDALTATVVPAAYDLCVRHADSLSVPNGWTCEDRRPAPPPLALPQALSLLEPDRALAG